MRRKDTTTLTRTLTLEGGSIPDLLHAAASTTQELAFENWKVEDVMVFEGKDDNEALIVARKEL